MFDKGVFLRIIQKRKLLYINIYIILLVLLSLSLFFLFYKYFFSYSETEIPSTKSVLLVNDIGTLDFTLFGNPVKFSFEGNEILYDQNLENTSEFISEIEFRSFSAEEFLNLYLDNKKDVKSTESEDSKTEPENSEIESKTEENTDKEEEVTQEVADNSELKQEENRDIEITSEENILLEKESEEEPSLFINVNKDAHIIVLLFKNLGISSAATEKVFEMLPNNITLGFSPYSPSLEKWVDLAIESEKEFLLQIPIETKTFESVNSGPYALSVDFENEENLEKLKLLLSLTKHYGAVYSDVTDMFSHSTSKVIPILEELKKRRLSFLYGGGYSNFSFIQISQKDNYSVLVNDILIDEELTEEGILKNLLKLENISRKRNYSIGMANPYLITMNVVKKWLLTLKEKDIQVLPISFLLDKK